MVASHKHPGGTAANITYVLAVVGPEPKDSSLQKCVCMCMCVCVCVLCANTSICKGEICLFKFQKEDRAHNDCVCARVCVYVCVCVTKDLVNGGGCAFGSSWHRRFSFSSSRKLVPSWMQLTSYAGSTGMLALLSTVFSAINRHRPIPIFESIFQYKPFPSAQLQF